MFLRQLEYLIAVIEEDHFGRAAEKCNVKQPSLSNGIKQLESELGITLFKRGRGQRLYGITEEGKKVNLRQKSNKFKEQKRCLINSKSANALFVFKAKQKKTPNLFAILTYLQLTTLHSSVRNCLN